MRHVCFVHTMVRWHSRRSRMKVTFRRFHWFVTTTKGSTQCARDACLTTCASCVWEFRFLAAGTASYEKIIKFEYFWFRGAKFLMVLRNALFWMGRMIRWDWRWRNYCITLIPLFPTSCDMYFPILSSSKKISFLMKILTPGSDTGLSWFIFADGYAAIGCVWREISAFLILLLLMIDFEILKKLIDWFIDWKRFN